MAEKRVPMNALPRAFMWSDGHTYVPHQNGTNELPPGLIVKLVEMGVLPEDRLPDDADPNDIATAQTQNAARTGDGSPPPPGVTPNGDGGQGDGDPPPPGVTANGDGGQGDGDPPPPGVTANGEQGDGDPTTLDGANADAFDDLEAAAAGTGVTGGGASAEGEGARMYTKEHLIPDGFPGKAELIAAGYTLIKQVQMIDPEGVPGIGPVTAGQIADWLAEHVEK